jgi:hypothetical protein
VDLFLRSIQSQVVEKNQTYANMGPLEFSRQRVNWRGRADGCLSGLGKE